MTSPRITNPLCVALDVPYFSEAEAIVGAIGDLVGVFKVEMELYTSEGPDRRDDPAQRRLST